MGSRRISGGATMRLMAVALDNLNVDVASAREHVSAKSSSMLLASAQW
jgi:hypothetical protein